MLKTILREIVLYWGLFIIVAFIIQADRWMQNPAGHLLDIFTFKYGAPWMPLLFTTVLYFILLIIRRFFSFAVKRK